MIRDHRDDSCSIARSMDLLGDGWSMLIVRNAMLGVRRFADFEATLAISKNVLSARLDHLVEHGILDRVDVGEHGTRYEYVLTAMGRDLTTVFTALRQWGDRWIFGEGNEPLVVHDRATGEPILPVRIRRADGTPVPGRDLEVRQGVGGGPTPRGA